MNEALVSSSIHMELLIPTAKTETAEFTWAEFADLENLFPGISFNLKNSFKKNFIPDC